MLNIKIEFFKVLKVLQSYPRVLQKSLNSYDNIIGSYRSLFICSPNAPMLPMAPKVLVVLKTVRILELLRILRTPKMLKTLKELKTLKNTEANAPKPAEEPPAHVVFSSVSKAVVCVHLSEFGILWTLQPLYPVPPRSTL